jgi:putative phage-type endonuclease
MNRTEINLTQGSTEWEEHRRGRYNASELATAIGINPNETRNDLIRLIKYGTKKEYSKYVQEKVFPKGHRVEPIVRSMVEAEMLEDFIPTCWEIDLGLARPVAASLDGVNFDGTVNLEIKQHSQSLWESVTAGILPDHHKPQVQQGMLANGAERCIFAVCSLDEQSFASIEVEADPQYQADIKRIWAQFEADIDAYTEVDKVEFLPVAEVEDKLPIVQITSGASGAIAIESNLEPWFDRLKKEYLSLPVVSGAESAGDVNSFVKSLEKTRPFVQKLLDKLRESKKPIDDVENKLAVIDKWFGSTISHGNAVIAEFRKQERQSACAKSREELNKYYSELAEKLGVQVVFEMPDFMGKVSRLRNHESLQSELGGLVAMAKIEADKQFELYSENLNFYRNIVGNFDFLFADLKALIAKPAEDFQAIVKLRIAEHQQREAEKAEAAAKAQAEREAAIKHEAEEKAQREAEAKAEQERARIRAEEAAKLKAEADAEKKANLDALQAEIDNTVEKARQARPVVEPVIVRQQTATEQTATEPTLNQQRQYKDEMHARIGAHVEDALPEKSSDTAIITSLVNHIDRLHKLAHGDAMMEDLVQEINSAYEFSQTIR